MNVIALIAAIVVVLSFVVVLFPTNLNLSGNLTVNGTIFAQGLIVNGTDVPCQGYGTFSFAYDTNGDAILNLSDIPQPNVTLCVA